MTVHLAPLDYLVVVLFLAAILALGFSAKVRNSTLLQYLAAGRSLSTPAFVATLVSTWYGGILGVGESVESYGVGTWLLLGVPYYFFALIYAYTFALKVREAPQISIPERLHNRWGKGAGLVGAFLILMLAVPAAHVLMLSVMVQAVSGIGQLPALLIAAIGGSLFLYKGGLLADVRVGMLAFVMMYVGFLTIDVFCLSHFPPATAFKSLPHNLWDWTGGGGPITVVGFFLLGAWTLVDPGFHQRVASAATPESGRRGVLICIGFWFLFDMLSMLAGLYAIALVHPEPTKLSVYPALGELTLPPGLKAVFLCGILGTVLSAMVAYMLVSGATIGREIVGRLKPDLDERAIKNVTRVGFVISGLFSVFLARKIYSVVDLWYAWGGIVVGALLVPVSVAYVPKLRLRASSLGVTLSMALAFLVGLGWLIQGKRTNNPDLEVKVAGHEIVLGTLAPSLAVSACVLAVAEIVARRGRRNG